VEERAPELPAILDGEFLQSLSKDGDLDAVEAEVCGAGRDAADE
jgi:hypothetical protein